MTDCYFKMLQVLQSATVITKWGVTHLVWPKCISLVRSIDKGQEIITVLELLRHQTGYLWTAATINHNLERHYHYYSHWCTHIFNLGAQTTCAKTINQCENRSWLVPRFRLTPTFKEKSVVCVCVCPWVCVCAYV